MLRNVVLLLLLDIGLCAAAGAGAMPAELMVGIDCCVAPRLQVAPIRLELAPIGFAVLSLVALQFGFPPIPRRLIVQPGSSLVAPASFHLRC